MHEKARGGANDYVVTQDQVRAGVGERGFRGNGGAELRVR